MTLNDRNIANDIVSEYESTRNDLYNAALVVFRNPRTRVDWIEDVSRTVSTFVDGPVFHDLCRAFRAAQVEREGRIDEENMKTVRKVLT